MNRNLRLGVDFGYKYTGIALLDSNNKVLDAKVLEHRLKISDKLQTLLYLWLKLILKTKMFG